MYHKPTILTEFILGEERLFKKASGSLTLILTHIENAGKIIAAHIKRTGLVDILGKTGKSNIQQEEVQKLDEFSNTLFVDTLLKTQEVYAVASEELDKPVFSPTKKGKYVVFLDPLDGSSNIDVNINTGTIFSIYHKKESLTYRGEEQVAAGYILYGSSVMFVYSCGFGVNGFTLDPGIGSFLLSHPAIKIPEKGNTYSINEGYANLWTEKVSRYITSLKTGKKPYKLRYVGTLVADMHRTLLKGGVYLYPEDMNNKEGKLRLMFEINPFSFIVQQAGGMAVSLRGNPLTHTARSLHERIPIVIGSSHEVQYYNSL